MFYSLCCKSSKFLYSHGSFLAFILTSDPLRGHCISYALHIIILMDNAKVGGVRRDVDRNDSRQCPTLEFCISGVEPSDSATREPINY